MSSVMAFAIGGLPQIARAGNDEAVFVGDDAAMMGGAVTAIAEGGAALWYNPAGVARTNLSTLDLSVTAYGLNYYKVSPIISLSGGESIDASVTELVVIPTSLTYVRPVDDNLRVGFGLFAAQANDFTLRTDLSTDRPGGRRIDLVFDHGTQLVRYHGIAGLAYRFGSRLHIGAAVQAVYLFENQNRQAAAALIDATSSESDNFVVHAFQSSYGGVGVAASVGVQWQPDQHWVFGASVVSPFALIYSSFESPSIDLSAGVGASDRAEIVATNDSAFGFELAFPAKLRLGAAHVGDQWGISVDGNFTHAVTNRELGLERRAVWNLHLGGFYSVGEDLRLGLGVFTDRSAAGSVDQFGEFRTNFYGVTLGVSFQKERNLNMELEGIEALLLGTNIAIRYAYGEGDFSGLVIDDTFSNLETLVQGQVVRTYGHEFTLYVGSRVRF